MPVEFDWVQVITQVGFPIAVTGYLLWERSGFMRNHTVALEKLVKKIEVLIELERRGNNE